MVHRAPIPLLSMSALLLGVASCLSGGGGGDFDDDDDFIGGPEPLVRQCRDSDPTLAEDAQGQPLVQTIKVELTERLDGLAGPDEAIHVNVPEALDGLSIVVDAGGRETLMRIFVDDDEINFPDTTPSKARTVNLPFDDDSRVEGGCLAIQPLVEGGSPGSEVEVHLVARVSEVDEPVFGINFIVVGGTTISESQLEAIFEFADTIYQDNGAPALEVRSLLEIEGPAIVDDESDDLDELVNQAFGDDPFALNVIILQGFEEPGVLGFAGGVPGPTGVVTVASAVTLAVDAHLDEDGELDTDTMGSTLAHELAHQLGLFHTSEQEGDEFDPLSDTPRCDLSNDENDDGEVDAEECADLDGPNLMFYETAEETQTELSDQQVELLLAHPLAIEP